MESKHEEESEASALYGNQEHVVPAGGGVGSALTQSGAKEAFRQISHHENAGRDGNRGGPPFPGISQETVGQLFVEKKLPVVHFLEAYPMLRRRILSSRGGWEASRAMKPPCLPEIFIVWKVGLAWA